MKWIDSTDALNFDFAMASPETLLAIHDEIAGPGAGRPEDRLEVLKRAAIVLCVTAWETYIEDRVSALFADKIKNAPGPEDVEPAFHTAARSWLDTRKAQAPSLMDWTQDRWKNLVRARFDEEIRAFNTPNTKNVRKLTQRYLGKDPTRHWKWPNVSAATAGQRLDRLIELRGDLVHRGADFLNLNPVRKHQATDAVSLCRRLVQLTDKAL